jgi:hypothetical protein
MVAVEGTKHWLEKSALARVAVVDWNERLFLDTFVEPSSPVRHSSCSWRIAWHHMCFIRSWTIERGFLAFVLRSNQFHNALSTLLCASFSGMSDSLRKDLATAPSFAHVQQQVADLIRGKIAVGKVFADLRFTPAHLTHFSSNLPP